ncbi:MAG: ArsS family sensor histidine kinase [Sulfuricurvum sp.]|jgi:two-component system OmpR family sensor kinase|uniref:ArsS family sensor histidine kinase n=1 Tax=Sulfuricurvum sp. TaxID=2025608 RepID=UPI0025D765AD|nr:ArsS family sensor histidine kinase [Sulfuricurvum sp.]MCK9374134.1 ArsS family sensor histidine kinase [Sulfuricurvum sp.]
MIARRHSVFFKLHLFFFLALLVLILLFLSALHEQERQKFHLLTHRSMELSQIVEESKARTCMDQNNELEAAGFQSIEGRTPHCEAIRLPSPLRSKLRSRNISVTIYKDDQGFIYELAGEHCTMYYRDTAEGQSYYFVWFLFFALFGGLVSMYLLLWQNLRPLKTLFEEIRRYGEGEIDINIRSKGRDEIALISNEFQSALEKQAKLKASRELFLRNMMHELKTPITKGKLIVELEEPRPNILLLGKLFSRMESLITQMAEIEKMHAFALERENAKLETLINTALKNLLISEEAVRVTGCQKMLYVDPLLFTSALQNLIDNAHRHASSLPIIIDCTDEGICVRNHGEALNRPIEEAFEAFVTEQGSGGLGLGLYIAKSVCELHDFSLNYRYDEGVHRFCIRFTQTSLSR